MSFLRLAGNHMVNLYCHFLGISFTVYCIVSIEKFYSALISVPRRDRDHHTYVSEYCREDIHVAEMRGISAGYFESERYKLRE